MYLIMCYITSTFRFDLTGILSQRCWASPKTVTLAITGARFLQAEYRSTNSIKASKRTHSIDANQEKSPTVAYHFSMNRLHLSRGEGRRMSGSSRRHYVSSNVIRIYQNKAPSPYNLTRNQAIVRPCTLRNYHQSCRRYSTLFTALDRHHRKT